MHHQLRFLPVILVALAVAPAASAHNVIYGVNDDSIRNWAISGPAVSSLGLDEVAIPIRWQPATHIDGNELGTIPATQPVLAVLYGSRPDSPLTRPARTRFCKYANRLTRAHPNIRQIQIWNEPETVSPFWDGSTGDYLKLLGACYDMLHKHVTVLGPGGGPDLGLQLLFVRSVHLFYQHTNRRRPLFDGYSVHPYWGWSTDKRVARAMDRQWRGLPQRSPRHGLRFWWTETGMESDLDGTAMLSELYQGNPSPWRMLGSTVSQATRVAAIAYRASRDPLVVADFNFLLWDELDLKRWQSGLLWADGERKPSFYAFRDAIRGS